jgi:cell division protein ZapA (FtsZ GTPase activity inhibitor)
MDVPQNQSVRVKIYDREYVIRTTGDAERLQRLARLLDRRMRETAQNSGAVDTLKVAVLTLLSLAEELARAQEMLERVDQSLSKRSLEVVSILDRFFTAPDDPPSS